jgi:hypothetical protein
VKAIEKRNLYIHLDIFIQRNYSNSNRRLYNFFLYIVKKCRHEIYIVFSLPCKETQILKLALYPAEHLQQHPEEDSKNPQLNTANGIFLCELTVKQQGQPMNLQQQTSTNRADEQETTHNNNRRPHAGPR